MRAASWARSLWWLGCALGAIAAGCSDASGTVSGGQPLFDAAVPGGSSLCFTPDGGSLGGHTFSELYRDYFGNVNGSACAGPGSGCHTKGQAGDTGSGGYVCPTNDKSACYAGMRAGGLVTDADRNAPQQSVLYGALRKVSAAGINNMPQQPPCSFSDADMSRIAAWITAGAPND